MTMDPNFTAIPSLGIPFFVPSSSVPLGTVLTDKHVPKLFTPLQIKNLTIPHRIGVSPMATYSGFEPQGSTISDFHMIHYGSMAMRGVGFIIAEATSASPDARATVNDLGIWSDQQALAWKRVVDFVHSQGGIIGLQLAHHGRKASQVPMPINLMCPLRTDQGGWADQRERILGPSEISFSEEHGFVVPTAMSVDQIREVVADYKTAAKRALDIAGFDFVEVHAAHGFLLNTFLSAFSNKRTDEYGGSLENRMRFLLEIVDELKDDEHPLFVRISGEEYTPENPDCWTTEDSVKAAHILAAHGVDVLDLSAGGNNINAPRRSQSPGSQVPIAAAVKRELKDKLLVATVGCITTPEVAAMTVANGWADIVLVGRPFLKNPGLVWEWADKLRMKIEISPVYNWPFAYK